MKMKSVHAAQLPDGFRRTDIGRLPADWGVATIGAHSQTSSGTTPPRALYERYYDKGHIAWVKTLDLNNAEIFSTDELVTNAALNETSLQLYPPGSVLVAMYGGFNQIGRTGLLRIPAAVNQALTVIRPDANRLNSEYLLRVLNFRIAHWRSVASSSRKDPNITSKDVREFLVPLPTIVEQESIAEVLSDADALIESLERLLAKKRQIKQGAMQELLTGKKRLPGFGGDWKEVTLGDLATLSKIGMNPAALPSTVFTHFSLPAFDAGAAPVVEEGSRIGSNKYLVPNNAVLMSKLNPRIPRVWAPEVVPDNAICSTEFLVLVPRQSTDRAYFAVLCKSPGVADQMEQHAIGTTGSHQRIQPRQALSIRVETPVDEREQAAIAAVFGDVDAEIRNLQTKLFKSRQIKQGLMRELLTGRIRLV